MSISAWGGPVFALISAWVECRSRPRVELDLGLVWSADLNLGGASISAWCGVPISAWGGAPTSAWGGALELDWVCVGIIFVIFCVEIVELSLCVVLFTV